MKAMILAAGLGTRLYPLTANKPKALVEMNGIPLIFHLLCKLSQSGFNEVIINLHHFSEKVREYLSHNKIPGMRIEFSDESDCLLDTGGGVKKALWFFDEDEAFLVHNTDIVTDFDLNDLVQYHQNHNGQATLCVSNRNSSRKLLFDSQGILCGWENNRENRTKIVRKPQGEIQKFAFNGIQIINNKLVRLSAREGVFSLIDFYLEMAKDHDIYALVTDKMVFDVGKPDSLLEAEKYFQ